MLKIFTSLALLCLLISMAVALAVPESSLVVRTEKTTCYKKRSPLEKRNDDYYKDETCPCAVATAVFNNKLHGITAYTQDECGCTKAIGLFSSGFNPDKKYCAFITDRCGKILHNITDQLNLKINKDGSTEPFVSELPDINLNCKKDGILLAFPKHSKRTEDDYYKECCSSYQKRQDGGVGSQMQFYED
ncbi:17185_t:CDS:1, partial [Racocetra persica]